MPRPAKFTAEAILDTSLALVSEHGAAALTITAVADRLGAPSGSIYHRFSGRDVLAGALWLRSVRRFQAGFLSALDDPDPLRAARRAATHVVRWSRDNPSEARLLLLQRSEDLAHNGWPQDLRDANAALRKQLESAIGGLCRSLAAPDSGARRRVRFAVVDIPYAAVRQSLAAGGRLHPSLDGLVEEAVTALLAPLQIQEDR
jgi:AcrR family transcriptional regulator